MTQKQGGHGRRPGKKRHTVKPGDKNAARVAEAEASRAAATMVGMCFPSPEPPPPPPEPVTEPVLPRPPKRR
eukprot:4593699-Prymnesium_polylepis.2